MNKLADTRINIRRLGKTLGLICNIAELVFILLTVAGILAAFTSLFYPDAISHLNRLFSQNSVYRLLLHFAGLTQMEPRYAAAIGCTITAITFGVLLLFTRIFKRMLLRLISSEKPFTLETASAVRKYSLFILILLLYNPVIAVILFLMAYLFSYLVKYGALIQQKADETSRIQGEMIVSFAEITENKSGQTGQHIRRVAKYTKVLARELGFSPEETENIGLASTMHDIGKLMIPSEILDKPGKLTDAEYGIIKTHPTYGGQLLENVEGDIIRLARTIALEHHERPDGRGYPGALKGEEISLEGRIVAVADVYDALTSRRSYKEAWTEDKAFQEIVKGSGTQFDPRVVQVFQTAYPEIRRIQQQYRDA